MVRKRVKRTLEDVHQVLGLIISVLFALDCPKVGPPSIRAYLRSSVCPVLCKYIFS